MEAAPPGQLKPRIVWVEHLSLPGLARLWLEARLTGMQVRFEARDAAPSALSAFDLLERWGLTPGFRRVALSLARRLPDGSALAYRREEEIENALSGFAAEALPGAGSSLRRALVCHLSMGLLDRSVFLTMAEAAARAEPDATHEYFVRRHQALPLLARVRPDRRVRQDLSARPAIKAVLRPMLLWLRAFAAALLKPDVAGNADGSRPAVWVEYYTDDVGGYISRAFWKDAVDPARFERVFYNDDRAQSIDDKEARRIADFGFRWTDARRPWALGPASPRRLLGLLPLLASASARPWWLRFFLFERELVAEVWEAAFRRHGVRAMVQHQDFSWQQEAQALALKRAEGVLIGLHWAEAPFLIEPEHLTAFGVYFAWGVNQSRRLAAKGHDCEEILPCGAWILPRDEEVARIKALVAGAGFSIALFDTSASERIFVSPQMLSDFMLRTLESVDRNPGWKVVLKPKRAGSYDGLPAEARIRALVERLTSSGRAVVLERQVSPVSAGLACDLSVGIGINSAALLAGAFGGRCVHWDCSGLSRHPLVRDGAGQVVFDTLERTLAAAQAAAAGDGRIGDFSRWARLVNHFGDRRAPERVGGWITDFMTAVAAGRPRADALREASDAYRLRHGVPADFAERGEWWVRGA